MRDITQVDLGDVSETRFHKLTGLLYRHGVTGKKGLPVDTPVTFSAVWMTATEVKEGNVVALFKSRPCEVCGVHQSIKITDTATGDIIVDVEG